jgi:hypothetical protein
MRQSCPMASTARPDMGGLDPVGSGRSDTCFNAYRPRRASHFLIWLALNAQAELNVEPRLLFTERR